MIFRWFKTSVHALIINIDDPPREYENIRNIINQHYLKDHNIFLDLYIAR